MYLWGWMVVATTFILTILFVSVVSGIDTLANVVGALALSDDVECVEVPP